MPGRVVGSHRATPSSPPAPTSMTGRTHPPTSATAARPDRRHRRRIGDRSPPGSTESAGRSTSLNSASFRRFRGGQQNSRVRWGSSPLVQHRRRFPVPYVSDRHRLHGTPAPGRRSAGSGNRTDSRSIRFGVTGSTSRSPFRPARRTPAARSRGTRAHSEFHTPSGSTRAIAVAASRTRYGFGTFFR